MVTASVRRCKAPSLAALGACFPLPPPNKMRHMTKRGHRGYQRADKCREPPTRDYCATLVDNDDGAPEHCSFSTTSTHTHMHTNARTHRREPFPACDAGWAAARS
jgi:hypothetical protein